MQECKDTFTIISVYQYSFLRKTHTKRGSQWLNHKGLDSGYPFPRLLWFKYFIDFLSFLGFNQPFQLFDHLRDFPYAKKRKIKIKSFLVDDISIISFAFHTKNIIITFTYYNDEKKSLFLALMIYNNVNFSLFL